MIFDGVGPMAPKFNKYFKTMKMKVSLHLHVRKFKTNFLHFAYESLFWI